MTRTGQNTLYGSLHLLDRDRLVSDSAPADHTCHPCVYVHYFNDGNSQVSSERECSTDYGGPVANRVRFALEITAAVAHEIGASRTGIVTSPGNKFNDIIEDDVVELYVTLVRGLAPLGLAYLHVAHAEDEGLIEQLRDDWSGPLWINRNGVDVDVRIKDIENGLADVVTIGTQVLANPDLINRIKSGAAFNEPDRSTFYGGDERGYLDCPTLS
jgi:N-ethylmaleimide reductase